MASYGFNFRASTRSGRNPGKLYFRVAHGGESRSVTTSYHVFPDEWDPHGHRLIIRHDRGERSRELYDIESSMYCDLHRMEVLLREMSREGKYTVDHLIERYRSIATGNTLHAFTEKLSTEMEIHGQRRTAKAYRTAAARLKKFNGGSDLYPESFTAAFIYDFQQSLKAEGRSMNTISFYMRTLRAIYHKAIAAGYVAQRVENPFETVYTGISTTRKLALDSAELAMLSSFDPTDKSVVQANLPRQLGEALAMFMFCFYARGMCFVDMAFLKKRDLRGDTIRYFRHKTGREIQLKVIPEMRRIINLFAQQTTGSQYLFPIITDMDKDAMLQYESGLRLQNQRLKKIALRCGLTRRLSTHAARHSWATAAKNRGLSLMVISEGLGHANQHTTEIYLASLERSILDQAAQMVADTIRMGDRMPKKSSGAGGYNGAFPMYDHFGASHRSRHAQRYVVEP